MHETATGTEQQRLEQVIVELLGQRADDATICPSEAARKVAVERYGSEAAFRELMPAARAAAAALVDAGRVEVTQRGTVVDIRTARGPVRIRTRRT